MHRALTAFAFALAVGLCSTAAFADPGASAASSLSAAGERADDGSVADAAVADAADAGVTTTVSKKSKTSKKSQPDFIERYFPVVLPDNLEPEVADSVLMIWLLNIACAPACSSLWAPAVMTGGGFPDGFFVDMLISWALHMVLTFIPVVGQIIGFVNCVYLCPVATIAIYDFHLKEERRGGGKKKKASVPAVPPRGTSLASADTAMAF